MLAAERAQHADGRQRRGDRVGEGEAGAERAAVFRTGELHDPGRRLDDLVHRRSARPWSGPPKTADRTVDDARIGGADRLIAKPELLHGPGAEILDDDISRPRQLEGGGLARVALQVEHDAALVAIEADHAFRLG